MKWRFKILLWGQKRIEKGAFFFAPFSWLWGLFSWARNVLYDRHWLPVEQVSCPVLSVGNVVAGGTGKTPLVSLLASLFSHKKVAILSRGYGQIADEALLLQKKNPEAKIYVGKDRVALARKACQEGAQLILLDDGFQYRKLSRDIDIVLLEGTDPFGRGHYLPWGFLRESPKRLKKADQVFVVGPTSRSLEEVISLEVCVDQEKIPRLENVKGAYFCGIGNPHRFQKTVEQLGIRVISRWVLADHEKADLTKLQRFAENAKEKGAEILLCTEKDAVKLPPSCAFPLPLYPVPISLKVVGDQARWEKLIAKIGQKIDNYPDYGTRI